MPPVGKEQAFRSRRTQTCRWCFCRGPVCPPRTACAAYWMFQASSLVEGGPPCSPHSTFNRLHLHARLSPPPALHPPSTGFQPQRRPSRLLASRHPSRTARPGRKTAVRAAGGWAPRLGVPSAHQRLPCRPLAIPARGIAHTGSAAGQHEQALPSFRFPPPAAPDFCCCGGRRSAGAERGPASQLLRRCGTLG